MSDLTSTATTGPASIEAIGLERGLAGWFLDRSHFPRPMTTLISVIQSQAFTAQSKASASEHGLRSYVGLEFVGRWAYMGSRPLQSTVSDAGLEARVGTLLATRGWERAFEIWPQVRDHAIAANRALQEVDIRALDDEQLDRHVDELARQHLVMIGVHHLPTRPVLLAVAWYLLRVGEWTGASHEELMALLAGASSASLSATPACRAAAAAAAELLGSDRPARELLVELAGIPAAGAFVNDVRCRVVDGFDLDSPRAEELPQLIIDRLRAGLAARPVEATGSGLVALRERVPAPHRAEFDAVVAGAQRAAAIRDERGLSADAWSLGLLRRGLQEAGGRLVARGELEDWMLLAECHPTEVGSMLTAPTVSAHELRARADERAAAARLSPPAFIGGPPVPAAVADPASPLALFDRLVAVALSSVFGGPGPVGTGDVVRGVGVSGGTVEGTARVVSNPADLWRLEPGDILVTQTTTEAFNAVVHVVAGIVTDHGGLFSHAAIVAREARIPAVVGCGEATSRIVDGARVIVDGTTGTVTAI